MLCVEACTLHEGHHYNRWFVEKTLAGDGSVLEDSLECAWESNVGPDRDVISA